MLLLEAGPPDTSIWIHLPIGYGKTMWDPKLNWRFETEPDPGMNGRKIYWPRGKTLGGSSSINGLIYIRGQREDYDHWAALGNEGWSYDECLPYFKRAEGNQRGHSEFHGGDGPLKISDIGAKHELIEAFIAGAGEIGVPRTDDFNGARQEGAGYYQLTTHKGWRCSAAKAYLKPARQRPNLQVQTGAHATGLIFEDGPDGRPKPACRRRALPAERCAHGGALPGRGAAVSRRADDAATAAVVGHRPGTICFSGTAFRSCRNCRGSARTCKTICRCACTTNAPSPSPPTTN